MKRTSKVSRDTMAQALEASRGLVSIAAERLGLTVRAVHKRIATDPLLAELVEDVRNRQIDMTEAKLFQKINEGDMTAIIFYLKTQGKSRGYVERTEHSGAVEVVFRHVDA